MQNDCTLQMKNGQERGIASSKVGPTDMAVETQGVSLYRRRSHLDSNVEHQASQVPLWLAPEVKHKEAVVCNKAEADVRCVSKSVAQGRDVRAVGVVQLVSPLEQGLVLHSSPKVRICTAWGFWMPKS